MKYCCIIILAILTSSCRQSIIDKHVAGSDSLVIHFSNSSDNSIVKTVSTTEDRAIRKLAGFVKGKKTEQFKCGYDGNLVFFSKGAKKAEIAFQYKNAACRHFVFEDNGELVPVKMNQEAADFLESLSSGRTFY